MTRMTAPRVRKGGTPKDVLIESHRLALAAIDQAIAAFNLTEPKGRDYLILPPSQDPARLSFGLFKNAEHAWSERQDALRKIRQDIEAIAGEIS